jgi:sortase A
MKVAAARRLLVVALLATGVALGGFGGWIQTKAYAAQLLLKHSWQQTLEDGSVNRPWPWADHWPIARMTVPSRDIDQVVLSEDSGSMLAFAPGHNVQSAMPGQAGTVIISGHRDTHFRFLEQLRTDEQIQIETEQGISTYQVVESRVVDSDSTRIQLVDDVDRLLLVTCYPFDALVAGGSLRYVVTASRIHD